MGFNHVIHSLLPYWIYMRGNIQDITLVLEVVDYCGCVNVKYISLFNCINGIVYHKTDVYHP